MANFDRGIYEPSEEAREGTRVFDGSEEEDDIEGSRWPLLLVLALLVLAMFGGVVWLAYIQGVARGRGETPVLAAANGPERVAPPEGGGNTVPYQGFKIYEQPAPPDDSSPASAAPKAPPAQAVAPTQAAATPKTAATPPPGAKTTAVLPKTVAALIQQANSVPEPAKPASPPPAMKPAVPAAAPGPATGAPRPLVAAAKPAAPVAAAAAATGYVLQIGAYKSQADAEAAWKTYQAKHAALLTGYADNVQQVDLGEKGTWYRLRIGGFADREVATALCDRLKADGGACIPGR